MADPVESLEELKAVIKEKTKENKNLQKKLGKLEDGYVKKHTELSEILAEKEFFVRLFKLVFPDKSWDKTLANKDYEQLESLWIAKEEELKRSVLEVSETSIREIQKLKTIIAKKAEEIQDKDETIKTLKDMETDYIQTQANLAECKGEILALEKQLESLKLETAALRNMQDELAKTKASSLLAALDQRPGSKSESNSDLEKTQKQLSAALKRIEELENLPTSREHEVPAPSSTVIEDLSRQKADYERRLEDLQEKLEAQKTEFQEHRKKAQKMIMEKDMTIERLKQTAQREPSTPTIVLTEETGSETAQQIASLRLRVMDLERSQSNGKTLNVEYLRNIVAKYMEYMNAANYPEAKTLEVVISTVLNFSPEDVELIHKAKDESGIVHKMTTIINPRSPGVGVSHNTLHTVEGRKRARLTIPHSVNVSLSNTYRSVDEEEKYEVVSLDKS